jgi:hypothetical protein
MLRRHWGSFRVHRSRGIGRDSPRAGHSFAIFLIGKSGAEGTSLSSPTTVECCLGSQPRSIPQLCRHWSGQGQKTPSASLPLSLPSSSVPVLVQRSFSPSHSLLLPHCPALSTLPRPHLLLILDPLLLGCKALHKRKRGRRPCVHLLINPMQCIDALSPPSPFNPACLSVSPILADRRSL